ncbi:hypothetical protein FB384_005260 [Prauserella sediminis]|uniref:Uncharacterized protein n=1 Tax=Prauserella sediminis TaxID=577680 RepID=A0A839XVY6_9PSEU|nr:hypothetical protein [Prauserella sediminis]MBB3666299.1 hypothetical protein [Prauserella sediminis]
MGSEELNALVESLRKHLGVGAVDVGVAASEGIQRGLAEIRQMSEPGVHEAVENIMDAVVRIRAICDHAWEAGALPTQ